MTEVASTGTPRPARAASVLIFLPGLPRFATNSGDTVADVVAATLDRRRPGRYRAATSATTAPRGLRVAKTVFGLHDEPVLDVFELDYRGRMEDQGSDRPGTERAAGALRAGVYAVTVAGLFVVAAFRGAKEKRARLQMFLGLLVTLLMVGLAVTAVGTAAASTGWFHWLPYWAKELAPESGDSSDIATTTGAAAVGGWVLVRRSMLVLAEHIRQTIRYLKDERFRDTVTQTLDDAVDGLLDDEWTGPIHVLGYSFGSLVAVDALLPPAARVRPDDRLSGAVTSLTTLGCPADALRLYFPSHLADRRSRVPGLPWTNVFIPADVFGSNLANKDDFGQREGEAEGPRFQDADLTSRRYTDERLGLFNVFAMKGFRIHGGYWDFPESASCFDLLVDSWVPRPPATAEPAKKAPAKKAPAKKAPAT